MGTIAGKQDSASVNGGAYSRRAYHAGSWYSDSYKELNQQLTRFLQDVSALDTPSTEPLRAVICPHAGYSYSGPTAAASYHNLTAELSQPGNPIAHILVLHPSHHFYLEGCAVSGATQLETPVGNLRVDDSLRQEILRLPGFSVMEQLVDEEEHSGEMQYPYIAKALETAGKLATIPVLPVMCGNLSTAQEQQFGKTLAAIIARSDVLCVISSDFCHWGSRFQYQPMPTSSMAIHEYIREMDHQGMNLIELQEPGAFAKYLKRTRNTICGRHAIAVWLNAVHADQQQPLKVQFIKYDQSSPAQSTRDSSVSYASATARRQT